MTLTTTQKLAGIGLAVFAVWATPASAQQVKPLCTDSSRACLLKTAKAYINGLSRHDASAIPFTPDVRCTEQGNIPVTNEATFRSEINSSTAITGIRNVRLMVDITSGEVAAFYVLDVAASATEHAYTVRRGQRFKIVRGLVAEVEVINYVDPKLPGLADPLWPDTK